MQRANSLEKTLMLGKIEGRRRREWHRMRWWMASPTRWTWVWASSGSCWWTGKPGHAAVHGVIKSRTGLSDWTTIYLFLILTLLGLQYCVDFPLVAASGGYSSCSTQASHCGGCSRCGAWLIAVAHRLDCSTACGIFPDQGLNLCLLHWQENSLLLSHPVDILWEQSKE